MKLRGVRKTVNGLAMFARVSPGGLPGAPPVVLVHGVGVSGTYLVPTAERLAPYYPTYVPDLPGFGRSAKPSHVLNIAELADALAAWMRQLGLARACLLGNSMGCQYIVDLALRYPELVRWAVLVGPTMDPRARTALAEFGRALRDLIDEPLWLWPVLACDYLMAGPIRTLVTLEYGLRDPLEEKLPRLRIPVLVVRGSRDPIAAEAWVEEMIRLLPRARLLVLRGATHAANASAPGPLVRAVRRFLAHEGDGDGICQDFAVGSACSRGNPAVFQPSFPSS